MGRRLIWQCCAPAQDALTSLRQDRTTIIVAHRCCLHCRLAIPLSVLRFAPGQCALQAQIPRYLELRTSLISLLQAQHHHGRRPNRRDEGAAVLLRGYMIRQCMLLLCQGTSAAHPLLYSEV